MKTKFSLRSCKNGQHAIGAHSTMNLPDFAGPALEPHVAAQQVDTSQV